MPMSGKDVEEKDGAFSKLMALGKKFPHVRKQAWVEHEGILSKEQDPQEVWHWCCCLSEALQAR